jgi:starch phosphorylase
MKMALNGALTVGTLDGANIEIRDAVGAENFFAFGLTTAEVAGLRANGYDPTASIRQNPELQLVLDMIGSGYFSRDHRGLFQPIIHSLTSGGDHYCIAADFGPYLAIQDEVDRVFADKAEWTRRAILNVARTGSFSSDRAVRDYSKDIWATKPVSRDA